MADNICMIFDNGKCFVGKLNNIDNIVEDPCLFIMEAGVMLKLPCEGNLKLSDSYSFCEVNRQLRNDYIRITSGLTIPEPPKQKMPNLNIIKPEK